MKGFFVLGILFLQLRACEPKGSTEVALDQSLRLARNQNKKLVLVFGADWCPDCRAFQTHLQKASLQTLLGERAVLVSIDVGRFDKNLHIAERYGNPIAKGIPAVVILEPRGEKILASTQGGEFSDMQSIQEDQVVAFFSRFL